MLASAAVACSADERSYAFEPPQRLARVEDTRLTEASGIVASRLHPGLFYTHNDSGGQPRVFVLDRNGRTRAVIRVQNARAKDWEDIALARRPDDDGFDVVVGDIGDNAAAREHVTLYRFAEPELPDSARGGADAPGPAGDAVEVTVQATIHRCTYPDGPRDAEGLVVDPGGAALIFTKRRDHASGIYRLPAPWPDESRPARLERVGELRFPPSELPMATTVTAADLSPDGKRLATRSYLCGWEWRVDPECRFTEPERIVLAPEPQGEALCYTADGDALVTLSERLPTFLYEVRRLRSATRPAP